MATSSGIEITGLSIQEFYGGTFFVDNISVENAASSSQIITRTPMPNMIVSHTGISGITGGVEVSEGFSSTGDYESGSLTHIPIGPNLWMVSGQSSAEQKHGIEIERKNLSNPTSGENASGFSGYIDLELAWENLTPNNEIITLSSGNSQGYEFGIYLPNSKYAQTYSPNTYTTGFFVTGTGVAFAGTGTTTGYFFTGISGFAGESGITEGTGTGFFTYSNVTGGTGTGLSDLYGLNESGSFTTSNTYIPTEDSGVYGISESGFSTTTQINFDQKFIFPATGQNAIFSGDNAHFKFQVKAKDADGTTFGKSEEIKILQPEIKSATLDYELDTITPRINSVSCSESAGISIITATGRNWTGDDVTTVSEGESFIQTPNGEIFNYAIIPSDQFGSGKAFEILDPSGIISGFTNSTTISGLAIEEINPGADPQIRLSWAIKDELADANNNSYYRQYIQVFDPESAGATTKPFDHNSEAHIRYGAAISDVIDFGSIPTQVAVFVSGIPGYGYGSGKQFDLYVDATGTGTTFGEAYDTYEVYNQVFYETGDYATGSDGGPATIYGIVESGYTTGSLIESGISDLIYDYSEILEGISDTNLNEKSIVNIRHSDTKVSGRDIGFFVYAVDSEENFITGEFITGSIGIPRVTGINIDNSTSRQLDISFGYSTEKENILKTEIYTGDVSDFTISSSNLLRTLAGNEQFFIDKPPLSGTPPDLFTSTYHYKFLSYDNFGSGTVTGESGTVQVPNVVAPIITSQSGFETTGLNGLDLSEIFLQWTGDSRIDQYSIEISDPQNADKIVKQVVPASEPQLRFNILQSGVHTVNISGYLNPPDDVYTSILSLAFTGNTFDEFRVSRGEQQILFASTSGFGTTGSGDITISLGETNKIASDGAGNIDFTSNLGAGDSTLFNITTDPDVPSIFKTDLEIHMPETGYNTTGYKLFFGSENQNTDPMFFTRVDTESDDSELRLYLGDNHGDSSNFDKFIIGSSTWPSTDMEPIFSVSSMGAEGAVGILTDSPTFPFHISGSIPGHGGQNYIAAINNKSSDGGGVWIEVEDSNNDEDVLRISNPNNAENLLKMKSVSGIFIAYDTLPASDPGSKGQIYRDGSNFLKISPG